MRFTPFGAVRLAVVAAAIEMFLGLAIYAFPREFSAPVYDPLRAYFPMLSPALVAGGVLLLMRTRYPLRRWVRRALSPLAAAPLAVLAVNLTLSAAWSGTALYGLLAAALIASPWLPVREQEDTDPGQDLFLLVAGLILASVGSLMLLQPQAFATLNYAGFGQLIPLAGIAGLAGAAVLLLHGAFRPDRPGVWVSHLTGSGALRLVGSALPLMMVYNFTITRGWTGVLAWSAIALALLVGERGWNRVREARLGVVQSEPNGPDLLPALERDLEIWTWLLALAVVALTGLDGGDTFVSTNTAHLFVLALTAYNVLVPWGLPRLGTSAQRIFWHLIFVTVMFGPLLFDDGPLGHVVLALMVMAPPLATRALGAPGGRILLAIGVAVVVLHDLYGWLVGTLPANLLIWEIAVHASVLAAGGAVGIRSAGDLRKLVRELAGARANLQQRVRQLALLDRMGMSIRRTLDLNQILRTTEEELGLALSVSRCSIELARGDGQSPRMAGGSFVPLPISLPHSAPGPAASPVTHLTAPIEAEDCLLGVITLQNDSPREWTSQETDFLSAVAGQVGLAILQARTHSALAERHEDLQQVHEELQAQSEELLQQQEGLKAALESVSRAEASHARLAAILEATPDFVATADLQGHVLFYNRAARSILGISDQADISGIQIPDTHPQWAQRIIMEEGIPAALRDGVWRGETALLSRDGREIPVSQVILSHKSTDGSTEYLSTIARDIREQKQAEEALLRMEERFRKAFAHAPIGMALADTDGRLVQANQSLCQMLGYSERELTTRQCDDLTHPDDRPQLTESMERLLNSVVSSSQMHKRFLHRDGHVVWGLLSISLMSDHLGAPLLFIVQIQDISEQKRFQEQLVHLANHDSLTDLLNRRRFQVELDHQLTRARRDDFGFATLFLDLDEFKYVNDTLGHAAGDILLRSLSTLLREGVPDATAVARLGGDEFGFLLPQAGAAEAERLASEILELIRRHTVMVNGQPIGITASIGIAIYPDHGNTAVELLAHADVALYEAKSMGRNLFRTYLPDSLWQTQAGDRLTWEQRIREALEENRFVLDCQPIRNLRTGEISQYELLLRMVGDNGEIIAPDQFLGIAEQFGLIRAIDRWVVRQAIHYIAGHNRAGRHISLAVNLSSKALGDTELLPLIQQELAVTAIDPSNLILEITETAAVTDLNQAIKFLATLKEMGCRMAIDDFGAGFSSLSRLKHLPVDFLKLDGSFVINLVNDPVDQQLVKAMAKVARAMGLKTIAEFACDDETVALLRKLGVDHAQGFHIGRPRPVAQTWPDLMR